MKKENDIPGYTISEVIHEGDHTVVYRARNNENGSVVLKSLRSNYSGSSTFSRLTREFDTLKNIDIEGVNKVTEIVSGDNMSALVMEDLGGVSVSQYAKTNKVDLSLFLVIAIKITDILSRLHAKNIMHKNITPDNIIINPSTGEIRIIDFGISTRLTREHTSVLHPNVLEGSLAYMSPEQTGRMNRSIDYRTDLYSLGISFYEMLTGRLPFVSDDPMELIHCHIAKKMLPVSTVNPEIPKVLSDIVLKLTAKIAEDRYQSAIGVKCDLEHCLRCLQESGNIPYFTIGVNDVFSRFKIPENLYGREKEVQMLLDCFEEVVDGNCMLMLVAGHPGIGKTALVNEIHKSTIHKRGFFISGKFDQYNLNIPFSAFRMAFSELLKYLISEPKQRLDAAREELMKALGLNASILLQLVPEFEVIIGKQNEAYQLNPAEAQHRFFFTLKDFIQVFATEAHPLIIFLDDLQWSDEASLSLIRELVTKKIPYVFLVGAYRNVELNDGHPLMLAIEELKAANTLHEVTLAALEEENVNRLIADCMLSTEEETKSLTAVIYKRTGGNPFYINEILKTIYHEGLINFNFSNGKWSWDIREIESLNISDNVLQFMTEKLKELPANCLEILEYAACIGGNFKLKTLMLISGRSASEIAAILRPAIEKELLIPSSEDYRLVTGNFDFNVSYRFLHDRIQQAAYSLLEEGRRQTVNLKIGRVLLGEGDDMLIELVRHYNDGRQLITDVAEKIQLATMNLQAGKKAQSAVAYAAGLNYFKTGIELLPATLWEDHYQAAFELYIGCAQNAYQTNDSKAADECISILLQHARTKLDKIEVLSLRLRQYNTVGKAEEAINTGVKGLALLGIRISANPGPLPVLKEIIKAKWNLGKRTVTDLVNAPVLKDPEKKAAARLLSDISPAAYTMGRDNLFGLVQMKIVNLSLLYGNCPESAYAFITFGTVQKEAFGNLQAAESYGRLGLTINEALGDIEYRCRVIAAYGVLTHHFNNHWTTSSEWFKKGIEAGYLSGDLFFLGHCAANCITWNPSIDLSFSLAEQARYLQVVKDTNYKDAYYTAILNLQYTKNLMGLTNGNFSLSDHEFNDEVILDKIKRRKYLSGIGMYHIHEAEMYLFYEDYEKAYEATKQSYKYAKSLLSLIVLTRLCITSFFSAAGCLLYHPGVKNAELKKVMQRELKRMKKWATYNPVNFLHLQYLMEAQACYTTEDFSKAGELFDKAIQYAKDNGWLADEAYANELAAKFYQKSGMKASVGYWSEAFRLYKKWGAVGKVKFLEAKQPEIFSAKPGSKQSTVNENESSHGLDVATIIKSSQAISGEIELKSLLGKMINIIMMNAGAENGMLLLQQNESLFIQACAKGEDIQIMQNLPAKQSEDLPQSIVNYVSNLKEAVVLDNASSEGEFRTDPYIMSHQPKSVLCSPIIFMNKLYGIIYLENNISVGAFTEDRLKILNMLSSQMAISIENALLYANLEEKVEERTTELRLEKKKSDDLLTNILPQEVADELKLNGSAEARQFDHTTVMLTDFVNFTTISESLTAKELVAEIHLYFTAFDAIIERNGLEKIKTIGDAYLAVAGLPKEDEMHAIKATKAAIEIVEFVKKRKAAGALFDIRIGLNSGPVVAGIVGVKKFVYDIWGDTVNTAARMETNSEAGKINVSRSTFSLLGNNFTCVYRGKIAAKNKGMMDMYFVEM